MPFYALPYEWPSFVTFCSAVKETSQWMVRMMITEVSMQLEDIGRKEAVTLIVGLEAAPTVAMDPTAMECVVEVFVPVLVLW